MAIKRVDVGAGDVEAEDDDGGVSAGGSEAANLLDICGGVAAPVGAGDAALAEVLELAESLDHGEREEKEDGEAGEPGGDDGLSGRGTGEDAQGVEAGEHEYVDEGDAFEVERVEGGADGVDEEPEGESGTEPGEDGAGGGDEEQNERETGGDREVSGGERTKPLLEMTPVVFNVQQVIDQIVGGGDEAEGSCERDGQTLY